MSKQTKCWYYYITLDTSASDMVMKDGLNSCRYGKQNCVVTPKSKDTAFPIVMSDSLGDN